LINAAFIKKKKFFPNVKMKYCTQSLKITPMHRWLKANKLNRKNSRQWVGIRREERRINIYIVFF
jgi:phage protein U